MFQVLYRNTNQNTKVAPIMLSQNRENIIEICRVLAEQENLKVTVEESGKGAICVGVGVFVGGIFGGPVGMAVGGSLSSIAVAMRAKGKFKSVVEIINEMNDDQQRRLTMAVRGAMENIRPEDYVGLLSLALTTPSVKALILAELGTFLRKEFQMQIS